MATLLTIIAGGAIGLGAALLTDRPMKTLGYALYAWGIIGILLIQGARLLGRI